MAQDEVASDGLAWPSRVEGALALAWLLAVALLAALSPPLQQAMWAFCRRGGCSLNFPPACWVASEGWELVDVGSAGALAVLATTVVALALSALLPGPRPSAVWCLGPAAFAGGVVALVMGWTLWVWQEGRYDGMGGNDWRASWLLLGVAGVGGAATVVGWARLAVDQLRAPRGRLAAEVARAVFLGAPVSLALVLRLHSRPMRDERAALEQLTAALPWSGDLVAPTLCGAFVLLALAIRTRASRPAAGA